MSISPPPPFFAHNILPRAKHIKLKVILVAIFWIRISLECMALLPMSMQILYLYIYIYIYKYIYTFLWQYRCRDIGIPESFSCVWTAYDLNVAIWRSWRKVLLQFQNHGAWTSIAAKFGRAVGKYWNIKLVFYWRHTTVLSLFDSICTQISRG